MDGRTDGRTDRQTLSIHKPELLYNPAKNVIGYLHDATETKVKSLITQADRSTFDDVLCTMWNKGSGKQSEPTDGQRGNHASAPVFTAVQD